MVPRGLITVTTVLLFVFLGLLSPAPAARSRARACCMSYNAKPIPIRMIRGYREQTKKENCRIDAIIFYTVKKNVICADPNAAWVRKNLELLSSRLDKMSKTGAGTRMEKESNDRSATGTYEISTESFY